ncbi:MAG: hypothetical protein JHC95_06590 [Solirubrobacteraceae bacterium]|nr:hypothetical protein [Solirubrobacteraceae bacterium]
MTQPRKATKGLVVPFDRLQEALDDAVRRGRMQRKDAEELAARLLTTVGARTEEALGGMQDLVGTATARMVRGLGGQADGALAIADYEDLTAAQVTQNLDGLSDAQLRAIREHEVHHANRVSVLRAIDRQLG